MAKSLSKKRKRNMIILLSCLCLVIIAAIAVALITLKEEAEEETEETIYVLNVRESQIKKFRYAYTNDDDVSCDYTFVLKDDVWYYEDDLDFPVAQTTFEENVISNFASIEAGRYIEDPDDLSLYGLDDPVFTCVITLTDGTEVTITCGDYNEAVSAFYAKCSLDDGVYMLGGTVESSFEEMCQINIYEYATLDSIPGFTADTMSYLGFKDGDIEVKFYYEEDFVEYDLLKYSYWYIGSPFERLVPVVSDKMDDFLETLEGLEYEMTADYYATDEELEEYGLKDSTKAITFAFYATVTDDDGNSEVITETYKIEVGNITDDGLYYYVRPVTSYSNSLTKSSSRYVSLISKSSVEALIDLDPLDYMYRYPIYVTVGNMVGGTTTITTPSGSYTIGAVQLVSADDSISYDYTIDGVDLSEDQDSTFQSFYSDYMMSFVKQLIYYEEDEVEVDPTYEVYYLLTDSTVSEILVQFTVYDEDFYQVTVDGASDMLVAREEVDAAFETFEGLITEISE